MVTTRDKQVLKFLQEHQDTAFATLALAKLFYSSDSIKSSITVANRRLKKLHEGQYIQKVPRRFGESNYYYYYMNEEPPIKKVADVDDKGNYIYKKE